MRSLVEDVADVIAPSRSARDLTSRAHPTLTQKTTVIPWGVPRPDVTCDPGAGAEGPLRLGVVGVVADIKGYGRLPDLIEATRSLDVEWHLFGASEGRPLSLPRGGPPIVRHGAYQRGELAGRLREAAVDVCVLPSIGPETCSLAHAEILAAGVPAITSDFGALAERVQETGVGWTFDPWTPESLLTHLRRLVTDRSLVREAARKARELPPWTEQDMAQAHVAIWERARRVIGDEAATHRASLSGAVQRSLVAAERHRDTSVKRLVSAVRHSNRYRDLPLRRLISEPRRRRLESLVRGVRARTKR
jgi:glycosyltransferase involved in cell wall biosynthesis